MHQGIVNCKEIQSLFFIKNTAVIGAFKPMRDVSGLKTSSVDEQQLIEIKVVIPINLILDFL